MKQCNHNLLAFILKQIVTFSAVITIFILSTQISHAAEFAFDYDVHYTVLANGRTEVRQEVTLTNLVTDYYAQNYSVTMNSTAIEEVTATDSGGEIEPLVSTSNHQTIITLPFNVKVVGIDKQHTFTLSYVSRDIATKKGRIWEIIIPGMENDSGIRSYTVHLSVPPEFGKPAYFWPPPNEKDIWTLSDLKGRGITAAYGNLQVFTFSLTYHLENISGSEELQEITLPPDTAFQKVILTRLSENPENVFLDADGNWLAQFVLHPREKRTIIAEGKVIISLTPDLTFQKNLTNDQIRLYTQPATYWEQSYQIKQIAQTLNSARDVYEYVVEHLTYDYGRIAPGITRLGALAVLERPTNAVCMEFSDLFVALSRAAGIPAREVHGFAATTNPRLQPLSLLTDILHAWVEYYDFEQKLWIPVDPTWGKTAGIDYFTKLDFNHVTFAILGEKSDYPYPAGSFSADTKSKDVFIDFAEEAEVPQPKYEVKLELPDYVVSGFNHLAQLVISNTGEVLYEPELINAETETLSVSSADELTTPPYGYARLPVRIKIPFSFTSQTHAASVTVDGKRFQFPIRAAPTYVVLLPFLSAAVILGLGIFGILRIHERKKRTSQKNIPSSSSSRSVSV